MAKKLLVIVFALIIVIFSAKVVLADYASDYQNYVNQGGAYQSAYGYYVRARLNYLSSQSLDSQDKAMQATITMLVARDNYMSSYLTAIKTKMANTQGVNATDQGLISNELSSEIAWYATHSSKIPSAGSLSDLVADSDAAKTEYNGITLNIIYNSLITLGIGNNAYIRGEIENEITTLDAKIAEIKANQDKDTSTIERSVVDVQNKLDRSTGKDTDAKNLISALKPSDSQGTDSFTSAQSDLTDSNSYLKEANEQLLQIISQIKSAN